MTILIVALTLPNTVGFHAEGDSSSATNGSPVPSKDDIHSEDYFNQKEQQDKIRSRSHSLQNLPTYAQIPLNRPVPVLAVTPGATTKTFDDVFKPNNCLSISINLPEHGIVRNKSCASLHTLAAMEPQNTIWGKGMIAQQPKSLAKCPPPESIFDDTASMKSIDRVQSNKSEGSKISRRQEKEISFTCDNYTVQPSTTSNAGLHTAIQHTIMNQDEIDKIWVGTLGMPTSALNADVKRHIANKLEDDFESLVVYINDTDMYSHYENYCKIILWPMLHSQIPDMPQNKAYQDNSWSYYVSVNASFADCIVKNYKVGNVVWVHDYHLLLVPGLVRKELPQAQIGLFVHSAFPPSEIFRCLPSRYELLEGMLGANMIAFQTDEFRYQFLQTCNRLLNIEAADHGLILEDGRFIDVFAIPMGVDLDSMSLRRKLPEVEEQLEILSAKFANKYLVVARDKLDSIYGLKQKLRGFADFLVRYPEWVGKVVLVQIATSTTRDRDLVDDIHDAIMHINSDYGGLDYQPIVYLNQDIDYSQYVALLSIADCMLVTSLCEGMNLTCHEFVVCQDGAASHKRHAPLILSEFVGAASVFGGDALLVNPWHPKGIAVALDKALTMGQEERKSRWEAMHQKTIECSARQWFDTYMKQLQHSWEEHSARDPSMLPRLKMKDIRQKYDSTIDRLFLIDLEGTLISSVPPAESPTSMPKKTIEFLTELVGDEKNTVYVMSHQDQSSLDHMFRDVPDHKLGLIAENGAFVRKVRDKTWVSPVQFDPSSWKTPVTDMLKQYEASIPGSFVQELESGVMLCYHEVEDQQDARNRAGEVANQINEMCADQSVTALPIEKGLLVSPASINKATAARAIQKDLFKKNTGPDFVLVIGDSNEDECVFSWAQDLPGHTQISRDQITTCVVGRRNSTAAFGIVSGTDSVVMKLEKLIVSDTVKAA